METGRRLARSICRAVVCLAIVVTFPHSAHCSMTLPLTPLELTRSADIVFAGSVVDIHAERRGGRIVTLVKFDSLSVAKGHAPASTLTMTLLGGTLDGELGVVDGQPRFDLGARYILFVAGDLGSSSNGFLPIVALDQGQFRVRATSDRAFPIVCDSRGLPLVSVTDRHFRVLMPDSIIPSTRVRGALAKERALSLERGRPFIIGEHSSHEAVLMIDDPGTRLSEADFLRAIVRLRDQ